MRTSFSVLTGHPIDGLDLLAHVISRILAAFCRARQERRDRIKNSRFSITETVQKTTWIVSCCRLEVEIRLIAPRDVGDMKNGSLTGFRA